MSWNYDLDLDNAADIFIALEDSKRRVILDTIRKSEKLTEKSLPSVPEIKELSLSPKGLERQLQLLEKGKLIKPYQEKGVPFYSIDNRGESADTCYYGTIDMILPLLNVSDTSEMQREQMLRTRFKILKFLNYDENGKTLEEIERTLGIPGSQLKNHLKQIKGVAYNKKTEKYDVTSKPEIIPEKLCWSFFLKAIYG